MIRFLYMEELSFSLSYMVMVQIYSSHKRVLLAALLLMEPYYVLCLIQASVDDLSWNLNEKEHLLNGFVVTNKGYFSLYDSTPLIVANRLLCCVSITSKIFIVHLKSAIFLTAISWSEVSITCWYIQIALWKSPA